MKGMTIDEISNVTAMIVSVSNGFVLTLDTWPTSFRYNDAEATKCDFSLYVPARTVGEAPHPLARPGSVKLASFQVEALARAHKESFNDSVTLVDIMDAARLAQNIAHSMCLEYVDALARIKALSEGRTVETSDEEE